MFPMEKDTDNDTAFKESFERGGGWKKSRINRWSRAQAINKRFLNDF